MPRFGEAVEVVAHKTTHQDGGIDEINVQDLTGELADEQKSGWAKVSNKPTTFDPSVHKTSHQNEGADEVSVQDLSGELADEQKSAWAKVSGKPTTFDPSAHKTSHQNEGADEVSVEGLSGELADEQKSAWAKISGIPTIYPPIDYEYAESLAISQTTSTTYQEKVSLVFTPSASAHYLVIVNAVIQCSSTAGQTYGYFQIDDAETHLVNTRDTRGRWGFICVLIIELDATEHTLKLSYKTLSSSHTASIHYATITAIRLTL